MQAASTCGAACRARSLISRNNLMGGANHTAIRPVKGKRVKDSKRIQKTTRESRSSLFGLVFAQPRRGEGLASVVVSSDLRAYSFRHPRPRAEGPGRATKGSP